MSCFMVSSCNMPSLERVSRSRIEITNELQRRKVPELMKSEIEAFDGKIGAEQIQVILRETYPAGWINVVESIDSIDLDDLQNESKYADFLFANALSGINPETRKAKIKLLHRKSNPLKMASHIKHLNHELGHSFLDTLEPGEKDNLKKAVLERINSNDAFPFSKIKTVSSKLLSESELKRNQENLDIGEYWAQIVERFFTDATGLDIQDFDLVTSQIRKTDPTFNWLSANIKRGEILKEIAAKNDQENQGETNQRVDIIEEIREIAGQPHAYLHISHRNVKYFFGAVIDSDLANVQSQIMYGDGVTKLTKIRPDGSGAEFTVSINKDSNNPHIFDIKMRKVGQGGLAM